MGGLPTALAALGTVSGVNPTSGRQGRQSQAFYLASTACRLEDEDSLAAASSWMRGGCRQNCDLDALKTQTSCLPIAAQTTKLSYLPPRRECKAAVGLHAAAAQMTKTL